ncbi:MAG TPA: hypothetical protein VL418_04130 [Devosiaceae bacterium]|nr:hypothetical protein [Devosiaceae bacterium]
MPNSAEKSGSPAPESRALTILPDEPSTHRGGGAAPAGAAFVSQLIAERQHLPPQRERRRAPLATALCSYEATERQTIRRLPPGYRKSLSV